MTARRALTLAVLLSTAAPLFAVTYLVPADRELIQRADGIVIATSTGVTSERTLTRFTFTIDEVLKGSRARGESLTLTESGGSGLILSGMPRYVPGKRYLVFTEERENGETSTWGLELGQFLLDGERALRNASGFDANWEPLRGERPRDARGFVEYIRGIVAQRVDPEPHYFLDEASLSEDAESLAAITRGSYLISEATRWRTMPSQAWFTSGLQPGVDGVTAATLAIEQWNATESTIHYQYGGEDSSAGGGFRTYDGVNAILFNDPNAELPSSVLARGGPWASGATYQFDGETFVDIDGGVDIVVNNLPFQQACLNTVLMHEMGHTLGLRHSNENGERSPAKPCNSQTQVCTANALMSAGVECSANSVAALRPWDLTAASTVYPLCVQPAIASISPPQSKTKGDRATLTVTATGIDLHYQWYEGPPGNDANPVGTDSPSFTSAPLSAATKFWVRITNDCGTATSTAVAVDVLTPKQRAVRH